MAWITSDLGTVSSLQLASFQVPLTLHF